MRLDSEGRDVSNLPGLWEGSNTFTEGDRPLTDLAQIELALRMLSTLCQTQGKQLEALEQRIATQEREFEKHGREAIAASSVAAVVLLCGFCVLLRYVVGVA